MSCDRLISAIWLRVVSATALEAQQKIGREQRRDTEGHQHPADAARVARAAQPADAEHDERLGEADDELLRELARR